MTEENAKLQIEKQILAQQYQEIQEQIQKIEGQLDEVLNLKTSIEEFSKLKKNDEFLAPLANGIFINTKLLDEKKLKINVGAGVLVDKTPEQALKLVQEQYKSLMKLKEEVSQQFEMLLHALQNLE